MSFEQQYLEERRRKGRRSAFIWGFVAAIALGIFLSVLGVMMAPDETEGDHIAWYGVGGLITDDPSRDDLFQDMAESDAKALILRINSPGGTTAGSEALFASIRRVAEDRPVVAVMGEVAASGGYIAALGADHIIARGNTITASIGVIMEVPDVTEVMDRIGIDMWTLRSSELKAEPAPYRPYNPRARQLDQEMIEEGYEWFRGLVGERRGLDDAALDAVADGRIVSGFQALDAGLIDEIGGEAEALAHLESLDEALADLPVVVWEVPVEEGALSLLLGKIPTAEGLWQRFSTLAGPRLYSITR
ncbi:signal peptide peptidase SppA [Oceanomicrobium pacificus]|uniref:Signal peptide peptidase SppA n=1 Tax=Oceanomicrobium pacificus TaxID=2692916 RepID=A0A6B0TTZ7_9RHOB|nr:signal peptide peptidase SppA [Oceanomicrobium pacificus]MXU64433.1 signal peptide peptidase SppA [Oceanomicrobium pacificus]